MDAPESAILPSLAAGLHRFHGDHANFPWRSHAIWIATQMLRWGELEKPLDLRAEAARIYRADLYRAAAAELDSRRPTRTRSPSSWAA